MKKIFLAVAVVAATMFASCSGNKDNATGAENDTVMVVDEEMVSITEVDQIDGNSVADKLSSATNSDSIASYIDKAKAYAQKLINEGKVEEAKAYLAKIEPMIKSKAPQLAGSLDAIKAGLDKLPTDAGEKADAAMQDAKEKAGEAYDAAKEAAKDKAEAVKESAKEKASAAKEAAKEKADAAKEKTRNAVNNLLK